MTEEDKQLIAEYMGWYEVMVEDPMNKGVMEKIITKHNHAEAYFDLNDAGLCIGEMQKQEDYLDFILVAYRQYDPTAPIMGEDILFFAWLMAIEDGQAKNFFAAFTEWRKGK